jgi:Macrocin-O-methyltransferase (TylF)/CoA binding domain
MDMRRGPFFLTSGNIVEGRQLVAYGAGLCLLQMQAVGYKFVYAVDDTPGLAGKTIGGLPVFAVDRVKEFDEETTIIVICANKPHSILTMASRLNSLGLTWGKHYIDCAVLQFESMLPRIQKQLSIKGSNDTFSFVRLLSFYSSIVNLSYAAGTWLLVELLEHCGKSCRGAIAECGVYSGGNAFITLMASQTARNNSYYLLDSFEGFKGQSQIDPASRMGDFKDVNIQRIQDVFRNFSDVIICQGEFHQTIPTIRDEEFLMVYIDCDLYEPTAFLCDQLYERVAKGGFLVFHDYWLPEMDPPHVETFKGVNRAVHDFLGSEISRLVVFPETTHAVLVKT